MASEWRTTSLGEVIELKRGYDLPTKSRRRGRFAIVSSSGPTDTHAEFKAKAPGVVTGRYGTIGEVYYITTDYWPLNTALYVKDFKGNDPRFISYLLRGIDFLAYSDKSAVPGVNRNHLHQAKVTVPPIPAQHRIANVLGKLDDKIELNRRMNRTLEKMAAAIFKSWFIDFDPVHAKAEGRDPNLPADIADLFPDAFEDSELGAIPKGWDVKPLVATVQLHSGGTPKTTEATYWDGGIPWFSVKDAPSDSDAWVVGTERTVTQEGLDNSAAQLLPERTTIISARGTVGRLALTGVPMAMNQSCYGIRGKDNYSDFFTYYSMRRATGQLQRHTHGTVFDTITRKTFETLHQVAPPPRLAMEFDGVVEPLLEKVRANLLQSLTLIQLRDTLLPKLLSGEIELPEAEPFAEEAAS